MINVPYTSHDQKPHSRDRIDTAKASKSKGSINYSCNIDSLGRSSSTSAKDYRATRATSTPMHLSVSCDNNSFSKSFSDTDSCADSDNIVLNSFVGNKPSSLTSIARVTYFFDDGRGGGFLSIPHLGRHGSVCTAGIARILEGWLSEKIANHSIPYNTKSSIVPILEESMEVVTDEIFRNLKNNGQNILASLSKLLIQVTTGHIYTLSEKCDDVNVLSAAQQFGQDYPLFLDLTIKAQSSPYSIPYVPRKKEPSKTTTTWTEMSQCTSTSYVKTFIGRNTFPTEIMLYCHKTISRGADENENTKNPNIKEK